jgi:arylsulfatase A-like enzyme
VARGAPAAALAAWALLAAACAPPRPSILFLSLDTLRRDAVGVYTPGQPSSTPNLDAFAARAVRFEHAFVPMPFTLPSHMSLFTGVHPDVHGVWQRRARLSPRLRTLPEILREAGYATLGVVTNAWMKAEYGFGRGFDHYERLESGSFYAERVNQRALELLDARGDDSRPVFLFLHYLDPHSDWRVLPYDSPPRFRADLEIDDAGHEFCVPGTDRCATHFLLLADRAGVEVPPAVVAQLALLYQRGVRYLDEELGQLFAALDARGFLDSALVVVSSDHGEEFREHGRFGHARTYDETLAVPLLIRFPGDRHAGRVVGDVVQTLDLLPTLADALGLPAPQAAQGRSLLPLLAGPGPEVPALSRDKDVRTRYALRTGRYKLIYDPESANPELYDLASDPAETRNLASQDPARLEALGRQLEGLVHANAQLARSFPPVETAESVLSPEEEEQLQEIGYLEEPAATATQAGGAR